MSSRTLFLAKLIGLSLTGFSLAMLMHRSATVATATAFIAQPTFLMTFGMIAVVAGLAIVLSHNRWRGGALTVVVTLFGWVILLRGLALLFLPAKTMARLFEGVRFADNFSAYIGATLAIGLYLALAGWRAERRSAVGAPRG